jgi:non-canonical (house-cleaning) NTP pyrophosphatase
MRIALWTGSVYKIRLLQHTLLLLELDPSVAGYDVASGVSDQPMKAWETQQWAVNRAINALMQDSEAELWCGIEFGYEPMDGDLYCLVHVCIVDRNGRKRYGCSSNFKLPKPWQEWLEKGQEVRDMFKLRNKTKPLTNAALRVFDYMRKDTQIIQALNSARTSYLSDTHLFVYV